MATLKKATKQAKKITASEIISIYMDTVLQKNEVPKNVFIFCKEYQISETDFYTFYSSFDALQKDIWVKFFDNAITSLHADQAYESYSQTDKLLALYFTLFEILTLNRSYVVFTLKENKEGLKNLKQLTQLRKDFKTYITKLMENNTENKNEKIQKITKPVFSEGAWVQFLFLLKFWLDDTSKGFEKTDIMIEKSVKATTDIIDTKALESLFDLGKFIWKEKFN